MPFRPPEEVGDVRQVGRTQRPGGGIPQTRVDADLAQENPDDVVPVCGHPTECGLDAVAVVLPDVERRVIDLKAARCISLRRESDVVTSARNERRTCVAIVELAKSAYPTNADSMLHEGLRRGPHAEETAAYPPSGDLAGIGDSAGPNRNSESDRSTGRHRLEPAGHGE